MIEKHLIPFFNERATIMEIDVQEFVDRQLEAGHSVKTVKGMVTVLRMIAVYASKQKGCLPPVGWQLNYNAGASHRRTTENVLNVKDYKALVNHVSKHVTCLNLGVLLALTTGMRIGELCALQWQDINVKHGVVDVYKTLERIYLVDGDHRGTQIIINTAKTPASVRQIPLPKQTLSVVKTLCKDANPECYMLTNSSKPTEPRSFRNHFNRMARELGLTGVTFHGLRHSFATRCIESRCDYKTLSTILGHSSVSVTMNYYVHPDNNQKKKCIENMLGHVLPKT